MSIDWQHIAALSIVAMAGIYVARLGWMAMRGKSAGCGSGCGSCSAAKPGDAAPHTLVALSDAERMGRPQ